MTHVMTSSAASSNGSPIDPTSDCSGFGVGAKSASYSGRWPVHASRAHRIAYCAS